VPQPCLGERPLPHAGEVTAAGDASLRADESLPSGPGSANRSRCCSMSARSPLGRLMRRLPASDFGSSSTCDPSASSAVDFRSPDTRHTQATRPNGVHTEETIVCPAR